MVTGKNIVTPQICFQPQLYVAPSMPQFMIIFFTILETHSSAKELLLMRYFIKPVQQQGKSPTVVGDT